MESLRNLAVDTLPATAPKLLKILGITVSSTSVHNVSNTLCHKKRREKLRKTCRMIWNIQENHLSLQREILDKYGKPEIF